MTDLIRTLEEAEANLPKLRPPHKFFGALLIGLFAVAYALECVREHSWACILVAGEASLCLLTAGFILGQNDAARAIAALRARGGGNGI